MPVFVSVRVQVLYFYMACYDNYSQKAFGNLINDNGNLNITALHMIAYEEINFVQITPIKSFHAHVRYNKNSM